MEQTLLTQEPRALPAPPPPPLPPPPSIPTRSAERERYALRDAPSPSPSTSPVKRAPTTPPPRRRSGPQTDGLGSRFSLDSETETPKTRRRMTAMMGAGEAGAGGFLPPLGRMPSLEEGLSVDTTSRGVPPPSAPPPPPPATTDESPAALASLTALQNSEALGRRASKRFSQYQYKQLLPGHSRGASGRHSRMGSVVEGELEAERTPGAEVPPVPALPEALRRETEQVTVIPTIVVPDQVVKEEPVTRPSPQAERSASPMFPVFLQYGRETRKATLDRRDVATIADLQALFVAKFEYAPADRDMFPDVYIKDPGSGVAYLLEDMEDVREGVLLSLNIDRESRGY